MKFSRDPGIVCSKGMVVSAHSQSSMCPAIVEKEGKLFLVLGSTGGSTIPTTVFQVITAIIDYKMNVQDAVDATRFHHQCLPDRISVEDNAVDSLNADKLMDMGHQIRSRSSVGRVSAIILLYDNKKIG